MPPGARYLLFLPLGFAVACARPAVAPTESAGERTADATGDRATPARDGWDPLGPRIFTTTVKPSKPDVFLALYENYHSVYVVLDATSDGVVLPDTVERTTHIILEYGKHLRIPIRGLRVEREGLRAILSFSQTPHPTFVPWRSVRGIITPDDAHGVVWESQGLD
jgi:hypothetical protein